MKKIFALLVTTIIIFAANVSYAAKIQPLAEITAEKFFDNMGYEIDCSYWETVRGKKLFSVILLEEPLIVAKDLPNMEIFAESKTNNVLEVALYLKSNADKDAIKSMITRTLEALDGELFQANKVLIEQKISELLNSPQASDEILVNVNAADRNFILSKETQPRKTLVIRIKVPNPNS